EMRLVQPLAEPALHAVLCREVQQAVGVKRANRLDAIKTQFQPFLRANARRPRDHAFGFLDAHPVLLRQPLADRVRRVTGSVRIELVAAPDHLDLVAVRELLKRFLKPDAANVAPRASDVRPNFNLHANLSLFPSSFERTIASSQSITNSLYIYHQNFNK